MKTITSKVCSRCKAENPECGFSRSAASKDGLFSWCKNCTRESQRLQRKLHPEKIRERKRADWRKNRDSYLAKRKADYRANPKKYIGYEMRKRYGISLEDYEALRDKQDGVCAICGCSDKTLCVDHDHKTGVVRSLLCGNCNTALGLLGEDVARLEKMIVYVTKHSP